MVTAEKEEPELERTLAICGWSKKPQIGQQLAQLGRDSRFRIPSARVPQVRAVLSGANLGSRWDRYAYFFA
jgi:hypothetical protein